MRFRFLLLLFVLIIGSPLEANDKPDPAAVARSMSWDTYWSHVSYLASDELEGRDTGSRGYDLAAQYTAEKFKAAGLQPFGDDSTYFQKVPFNRAYLNEASFQLTFQANRSTIKTRFGKNVTAVVNSKQADFDDSAEMVFVGYGNIIPEAGINDYENIDVKDKVVVFAVGGPDSLADSLTLGTSSKLILADEQGAKGALVFVPTKFLEQKKTFEKYHGWFSGPRLYISEPRLEKRRYDLDMVYLVKQSIAKKLFRKAGLSLTKELKKIKRGETRSQPLSATLACSYNVSIENADCKNVVGLLPGADSTLQAEYIVVGAHMDHVGIGTAVEGDSIYNGLWDNATGSGATIAMAETFHKSGIQPKRSIVFINYTGEEKGLLGSHYFANTYCVDSIDVSVNVNIDMLGGLTETTDITPLGYSHSTVSEAVDRMAEDLGIVITDATRLEKRFIHRSDQMSYMKLGIPPLNFNQGEIAVDPEVNAQEIFEEWMQTRYHRPSDDLDQPYDVEGFHTALKANFLATYYLANEVVKIEWYDDSWAFEKHVKPALEKTK